METYLAIITTLLVLTQIIRVTQNAISLSRNDNVYEWNNELMQINRKLSLDADEIINLLDNIRDNTR